MKKYLAMAVVAMMTAICAQAQSELVIDSICTADADGHLRQVVTTENGTLRLTDEYLYRERKKESD